MFRDFLHGLPRGFVAAFRGYNAVLHLLAIALTAFLVLSGFDWWYFSHTRGALLQSLSLPAAIIGFFMPVLLPVALYWRGAWVKQQRLQEVAAALAQAAILGWFVSSLYKSFTGRIQPEFLTYTSTLDISRDFNFGFWEHGIFWGWPSSHTAVAFAMAAAIIVLYPRRPVLRFSALLYALFIGVSVSISIHWFSDFVAGAIIGAVVGTAVARPFIKK